MERFIYFSPLTVYMVRKEKKFQFQSELHLFKALQKYGKPSNLILAKRTGLSTTTIHHAYTRLADRKFYQIQAVPQLPLFPEIPMAFLGFLDVHPVRLRKLIDNYKDKAQVRSLVHSEKELFLFLMDENRDKLTEFIFDIMELLQARPTLHIITPSIVKMDTTIPDKVLDQVYEELPDKRRK